MKLWLACFDIENNRTRTRVGKRLLRHGQRVQRSVFEILLRDEAARDALAVELQALLGPDDDLRFYPLCRRCAESAARADGSRIAHHPQAHVL